MLPSMEVKGEIVGRTERDTVCVCVWGGGGGGGGGCFCYLFTCNCWASLSKWVNTLAGRVSI